MWRRATRPRFWPATRPRRRPRMAVSKRSYRAYSGEMAPARGRFFVVTRYTFGQLLESKMFIAILGMCAVPAIIGMLTVYMANTDVVRILFNLRTGLGI